MKKIVMASLLSVLSLFAFTTSLCAFDRPLGDNGIPDDYVETLKIFKQTMDSFSQYRDQLPGTFDWRDDGAVTPAKDQGYCGSCWAFASVGALESKILMNGGDVYDISEQQQISCNQFSDGCCGGYMTALRFWYNTSPLLETCTDYEDYNTSCPINSKARCNEFDDCESLSYYTTGYYTVDTNEVDEIKTSLDSDGPGYFSFAVYEDFYTFWDSGYNGQVYTQFRGDYMGHHAVLLIGWNDTKQAWLCKNSWGDAGGPNGDGTFWIAYDGHRRDLEFGMANVSVTDTRHPSLIKILLKWLKNR